jgi:anti-sigma B factor antagonist
VNQDQQSRAAGTMIDWVRFSGLGYRVDHDGDRVVVSVSGDLDLASAPELRTRLLGVLALPLTQIVVDLEHLEFMDSTGLSALVRARRAARDRDIAFSLESPNPQVEWMLSLTGLAPLFADSGV